MRATIDGLASQLPPELVVRALELGLRTPTQAVSVAALVPDPASRIRVLQRLLDIGSPLASSRNDLETLAVETAEEWQEPSVYALTELAHRLQGTARDAVLRRALRAATDNAAVHAERSRAVQGLGIHDFYSPEREIAHALAAVALRLADEQRMVVTHDGVGVARGISDPKERAHALAAWMKVAQADDHRDCYRDALEAARQIENQQERLFALSAIAENAGANEQRELLDQIWAEAATIEDEPWRAFCLARAAPQFDDHRRRQCVELALRSVVVDRERQAEASAQGFVRVSRVEPLLQLLVPSLTPREAGELRDVIERIPGQESTARVLLELGLPFTDGDVEALFEEILESRKRNFGNQGWPSEFTKLASHLPASLVTRALEQASHLTDAESWQLSRLKSSPSGKAGERHDVTVTFSHGSTSVDGGTRTSWLLDQSVPTMDAEQLRADLDSIGQLTDDNPWRVDKKAYALLSIIAQLPAADLHEPWRIAKSIGDGWYRSLPLSALALRLTGEQRERAASEAVDALLEPGPANADRRANIIEQLIPVLTAPLVTRLLTAVSLFEEWGRIRALKALFPAVQAENFEDALAAVRSVTNDSTKAELLQLLVASSGEEQLLQIVEVAEGITDDSHCTQLLERIASHVTGAAYDGVRAAAERMSSSENRALVLARLLPASSERESLLKQVRKELVDFLHHGPRRPRADILAFLANRYVVGDPVLDHETLQRVIQAATDTCRNWSWQ